MYWIGYGQPVYLYLNICITPISTLLFNHGGISRKIPNEKPLAKKKISPKNVQRSRTLSSFLNTLEARVRPEAPLLWSHYFQSPFKKEERVFQRDLFPFGARFFSSRRPFELNLFIYQIASNNKIEICLSLITGKTVKIKGIFQNSKTKNLDSREFP